MPAAYAHYRFGQDVLAQAPIAVRSIIDSRKSFYDLGLHGPDLLFYYKPLRGNVVGRLGSLMHEQRALSFFCPAGELLRRSPTPELAAYIYGFICHFALDLHCHGYISRVIEQGGPGHNEQETDFDRVLLRKDGLEIRPGIRVRHIRPSMEIARTIAPLFPGLTALKLYRSMLALKFFDSFLGVSGRFSYGMVLSVLKLSGQYDKLRGMLLNSPPAPGCDSSSRDLTELYLQAQDTALRLMSDFKDSAWGRMNYDLLYEYNFDSCLAASDKENKHEF